MEWAKWESGDRKVIVERDEPRENWRIYMWENDKPSKYIEINANNVLVVYEVYNNGVLEALYLYVANNIEIFVTKDGVYIRKW